jgi:hypothetical protein
MSVQRKGHVLLAVPASRSCPSIQISLSNILSHEPLDWVRLPKQLRIRRQYRVNQYTVTSEQAGKRWYKPIKESALSSPQQNIPFFRTGARTLLVLTSMDSGLYVCMVLGSSSSTVCWRPRKRCLESAINIQEQPGTKGVHSKATAETAKG